MHLYGSPSAGHARNASTGRRDAVGGHSRYRVVAVDRRSLRGGSDEWHSITVPLPSRLGVPKTGDLFSGRRGAGGNRSVATTSSQAPTSGDASSPTTSTEASSSSTPSPVLAELAKKYAGKKAIVVGAGPAGSTAAMYLARAGWTVDVHERRPEPAADKVDNGRAYIIILVPRGKAALEELGVKLPTDPHFLTQGTVRHSPKGKVSVVKEAGNVTFSRADLAQFLIDEAKKRYPENIRFHFDSEVASMDLDKRKISFSSPSKAAGAAGGVISGSGGGVSGGGGTTLQPAYDLLVGVDGAASKVRDALSAHIPGFKVDVSDSGREYKVYLNLKGDIEPPEFKENPGSTLHLWSATNDPFMSFTAHRNPDDTYSGTFSMRTGGFAELKSVADYEALLRTRFSGIPEAWIPSIAAQAAAIPSASPAGKRIRCSQLGTAPGQGGEAAEGAGVASGGAGGNVLVLGDAAHAVTPVFGQGANSSLESARVLGDALLKADGDVDVIPSIFDTLRRPDAHGLYEIDRKAFSFFRRKGPFDPDFLQLLSHVILGFALSKVVPFLYGKEPKLFQLGTARYSEILAAVKRDSQAALVGLMVLVVIGVVKVVGLMQGVKVV